MGIYIEHLLHPALPKAMQVATERNDRFPDIYAALFFQTKPRTIIENAMDIARGPKYRELNLTPKELERLQRILEQYLAELLLLTAKWASEFERGVPRLVKVWKT
jgi:hypothetical protein